MKQRASDVLSLGGLQVDSDVQQLRKRKPEFDGARRQSPEERSRLPRDCNKENSPRIVYNVQFHNCRKVNYQMPPEITDN